MTTPQNTSDAVTVGLNVRAIPAGWFNGQVKLTLALAVEPTTEAVSVPYAELPIHAFAMFDPAKMRVEIEPITLIDTAPITMPAPSGAADVPNAELIPWTTERPEAEEIAQITALWQHVMPAKAGEDFSALHDGMKRYHEMLEQPDEDDPETPAIALPDYSGQIAIACQLERALVERWAIYNPQNWKEEMITSAVKATDRFLVEFGEFFDEAENELAAAEPNGTQSGRASISVSIAKAKAAKKIVDARLAVISAAAQAAGAEIARGDDLAQCRAMLRGGPADANIVAGLATSSFEDIVYQLLLLNQAHIYAAAMDAEVARKLEANARGDTNINTDAPLINSAAEQKKFELFQSRSKELETNTEFARLFGLTQDYALSEQALETIRAIPPITDPGGVEARYFMLRLVPNGKGAGAESFWTYAKLTDGAGDDERDFMPVSRTEIIAVLGAGGSCDARDCEILPELNGVRLLSAHCDDKHPAYELTSVNPRDATQDLDNRLTLIVDHVREARERAEELEEMAAGEALPEDARKTAVRDFLRSRPVATPWPVAALKSRSLRLYHVHRQSALDMALGCAAELAKQKRNTIALDAEDLSLGWLYAASARRLNDESKRRWSPLSGAKIVYDDERLGGISDLDGLIDGFFKKDERPRYQRATWSLAQQIKSTDYNGGGEDAARDAAVGDEVVFEYGGDQQGTDNDVGVREDRSDPYHSPVPRQGLIDITRRYRRLSELAEEDRPIELLNGLAYYIAARNLHVGGGSVPDGRAYRLFEEIECAAVPRKTDQNVQPGHRLLRTEKIVRPTVLLNGAADTNKEGAASGDFLPSTVRDVTLRSFLRGNEYTLGEEAESEELIIVPGGLDMELAYRHGVLKDRQPQLVGQVNRPTDALIGIRMNAPGGGWATLDELYELRGDGEADSVQQRVLLRRRINSTRNSQEAGRGGVGSSGIFLSGNSKTPHELPYYPDPLHARTMLRLRRPGTQRGWIGRPIEIALKQDGTIDPRPIALSVQRGPRLRVKSGAEAEIEGVVCSRLTIELPPGLVVELVMWGRPDLPQLGLACEAVTLQAMLNFAGQSGLMLSCGSVAPDCEPDPIGACLAEAGLLEPSPEGATCGIGCIPAPSVDQLSCVAKYIDSVLANEPVDVVGSHSVTKLVHAVDTPRIIPMPGSLAELGDDLFDGPFPPVPEEVKDEADKVPDLFARRAENGADKPATELNGLVTKLTPLPASFLGEGPPGLSVKRTSFSGENGAATDVDLAGYLQIDALTTSTVEIDLVSSNPVDGRLDDPLRTRGPLNILGGVFPQLEPGEGKPKQSSDEIYGFAVREDEYVLLKQQKARFARIDDIPQIAEDLSDRDLQSDPWAPPRTFLALHHLFTLADNGEPDEETPEDNGAVPTERRSKDGIRMSVESVLNFTQSRNLDLTFRAIGRFETEMTERARSATVPVVRQVEREWPVGRMPIHIPVPASRRPDPPVPARKAEIAPLPPLVTVEDETRLVLSRRHDVRLSFDRPFLSSGPEERIGIVLSPRLSTFAEDGQYAREYDGAQKALPRYRLSERFPDPKALPADLVDRLTQFADKGTRPPYSGTHPDAMEDGPYGLFPVPFRLFADVAFDELGQNFTTRRNDIDYVKNVPLPIYGDAHNPLLRGQRPDIYFPVDLLTVRPRFDMTREHWYCNLALDPRHTLDPHVQFGLVRYQPFAPPDRKVSPIGDPMRIKVLPRRDVRIETERRGEDVRLTVTCKGPGIGDAPKQLDMGPASRVTARLIGIERHGAALVHRHLDRSVRMTRYGGQVQASFTLPARTASRFTLQLRVLEHEERLASTQPVEPVQAGPEDQVTIRSGPVFQVSQDITRLWQRAASQTP